MPDPTSADKKPIAIRLEAGKGYAWCQCGHSKGQPFCDGSHKGTEFRPLVFTAAEGKEAWLCQCKHTKNPPYCDGTHKGL
jgi:CDGSH-type Zn-finger protein